MYSFAQSCLCNPMGCSPQDSSVHGISQARILEWVAISSYRGSSPPRDQTHTSSISCISRQIPCHGCHLASQESTYSAGDEGSTPGWGKIPWRRGWQPILVFLRGKSHGQRSLVGYSSWGRKESDMTEQVTYTQIDHEEIRDVFLSTRIFISFICTSKNLCAARVLSHAQLLMTQ